MVLYEELKSISLENMFFTYLAYNVYLKSEDIMLPVLNRKEA